ncbi:type II toxin-antitoxin system death-on-curing family toxin [Exilibacterium tricleocarpae]|uniref:type II toxin-antitoxin system death-on-curing family toxin n=1 Tax=Exilibacterium tricleocarpae TaxID=2591008 RepID=UPI001C5506F2|nr:type II toxin-antitoxin system death-on-curing family toxin [Exilibacterium tricleocarpae]
MRYLTAADVIDIHEEVINPHELQGLAKDKSIEAVVARIENRICYGMVADVFELAACYGTYIAVGHVFNDANKRTAFASMDTCLYLNNIELTYETIEAGDMIRRVAQGRLEESALANWLRVIST